MLDKHNSCAAKDKENLVESIRIEDWRILIKEPPARSKFSDWWNRLCVILGWIFLLMNLLMVIYRCVGANSKFFVCMNLIFFAYE